jgi:RNA polymerase sigma-70 factor (sigma-E family)
MDTLGMGTGVSHPVAATLPDSFTTAFPRLYADAYRAAFRLLGVRQEAEDVAQEACARALVRWTRLTRDGHAIPWVTRVASNLAIDQWRRRRRANRHTPDRPETASAADARRVDLHRALDTLPRRQRDAVVLRYVVDLSEADTAAVLGCAPGTVKSHASRGLAALRQALGEEDA